MWGFWDSAHWRPQAAIAEGDTVTPNQAGEAYIRLLHEVILTAMAEDNAVTEKNIWHLRYA